MEPRPPVTTTATDRTTPVELAWENEGGHLRRADPAAPGRAAAARTET